MSRHINRRNLLKAATLSAGPRRFEPAWIEQIFKEGTVDIPAILDTIEGAQPPERSW